MSRLANNGITFMYISDMDSNVYLLIPANFLLKSICSACDGTVEMQNLRNFIQFRLFANNAVALRRSHNLQLLPWLLCKRSTLVCKKRMWDKLITKLVMSW